MEFLFHFRKIFKIRIPYNNMTELDEKDLAILDALQKNAKQSVFQLAKKTAIPPTTIHNRLKKLKENKIIKKYTIEIDREKIGQHVCALIFVYLNNSELDIGSKKGGLAKKIRNFSNVTKVFETTGSIDLIVQLYGKDIKEITNFVINHIREIKGVIKTETVIALSCD